MGRKPKDVDADIARLRSFLKKGDGKTVYEVMEKFEVSRATADRWLERIERTRVRYKGDRKAYWSLYEPRT